MHATITIGAALEVAVELGDTQGTAGSMATTALRQGLQGPVGVVDGGSADGVEAHAQCEENLGLGWRRLPPAPRD